MRLSLRTAAIAALSLAAAVPTRAHADDASKQAKAAQLITLLKIDSIMQQQVARIQQAIKSQSTDVTRSADSTPEQQKLSTDYLAQIQTLSADISWEKARAGVEKSYADAFTEPELDNIVAFYKTPSGQALVNKTAELSGKVNEAIRAQIEATRPKLQQATKDYTDKLTATRKPSLSTLPQKPAGNNAAPPSLNTPSAPAPTKPQQ